jgi:hypothetical protein
MRKYCLCLLFIAILSLFAGCEGFSSVRTPPSQQSRFSGFGTTSVHTKELTQSLRKRVPVPLSSSSLQASPLDVMVTMYKDSLMDNPLETKLITGALLAFLGDAIAQTREAKYDELRAAALVTFDMVYRAVQIALFPLIVDSCDGHFLAHLFANISAENVHYLATMEQTIANQFFVIPFIYYPVFFTLTGSLQGLSMTEIIERARTSIVPLLKRNWLFWIPVQYFQFGYVDEPLQIPFLCVAGLAWTFILSTYAGSVQKTRVVAEEIVLPTPESVKI